MYKMLLVDPDRHSLALTESMLDWNRIGFDFDAHATTSADAMSKFNGQRFSLIMINMATSQDEGLQLCGRIRENSRVPIIFIGGSHDFQLARKALYYQVSDYLPAPVSPVELAASLENVKRELDAAAAQGNAAMPRPVFDAKAEAVSAPPLSIIDRVKEYVEEAMHQNITLKEISNILHFNYSYLGQKFKCHENMTFNEYLLQQRMEKAKWLLESTDMKVYEIANIVGYTEMDWFYKKFKSYTGVSANEYRKMISITA